MAKVGYIYNTPHADGLTEDREWMRQYGCVQVAEEAAEDERLRPVWKQLLANLDRGDEIVISKLSNAVRGSRELAAFIELCRVKVVRIISIHNRIDTDGKVIYEWNRTSSPLSDTISKDLKRCGMKFVGATIVYSFLQAIGIINSHEEECWLHRE